MSLDRNLRTTFDSAAKLYDDVRPGYPEQLIEDVVSLSEIAGGGRILEIGCGPGKATVPFAKRGYAMLCLELGRELAALATENCRSYPDVKIENVSFEDWSLQRQVFDLVISAQAFHWIPPEVGYARAAAALRDEGSIALFWNQDPGSETALFHALNEVYQKRAPELVDSPGKLPLETLIEATVKAIDRSGFFSKVMVQQYPWSARYTTEQYIKLLSTYSDHLNLAEERRCVLLEGVGEVIERSGGVMERPYVAVLYWAKVTRRDP